MELTAQAKSFRASFKKMMGMRANASHLEVLAVIKQIYIDNGIESEFLEKIARHKAEHLLEQI
jgi:2-hydroxy-3-keto-5-methylthiopentenyl-1-phosphate phosphatase